MITYPPVVTQREDILVSVCLSDIEPSEASLAEVAALARALDARFRFREIVLVARSSDHEAFLPLVRQVPDVRLLLVREGLSAYGRRVIAASEAIGDVVMVAAADQFGTHDHVAMIEKAAELGRIVVGLREEPKGIDRFLSITLAALGRAAGFRTRLQDGPTIALPRTLLNQVLEHSDPDLALRFVPRDPAFPTSSAYARPGTVTRREKGGAARRLGLILKMVVHMAPLMLGVVSAASALLTVLGVFFALYVFGVWLFQPVVAPGWLTLSLMLSLSAVFLGASIFGLSVGLQQLLMLLKRNGIESAPREVNRIDLFGKVAAELNVDLDRSQG